MKKLVLILFTINCLAQAPIIEWQKTFGGNAADFLTDSKQTPDGGYIVAGFTNSTNGNVSGNHGNYDFWILKLDSTGNIQWNKTFGGSQNDYATEIILTSDGGYAAIGRSNSVDFDVPENHGFYDIWVIKLDNSGSLQWQKIIGGTGDEQGNSIKETADGYIVAGSSSSSIINGLATGHHGGTDSIVFKLDTSGNTIWQKAYGGSNSDIFRSIILTSDNQYAMVGTTNSINGDVSGFTGTKTIWVVKVNTTGTIQWQKTVGNSDQSFGFALKQTSDNGYIVTGQDTAATDNHGLEDSYLAKLSSSGTIEWQKSFGGSGRETATTVMQTNDSGYIFSARSTSPNDGDVVGNHGNADFWIVRLNAAGTILWQKSLGGTGTDWPNSYLQTTDDGFLISGYSTSSDGNLAINNGAEDFWVVKLSTEQLSNAIFQQENLTVYPNPARQFLTVQLPGNTTIDAVKISELSGKLVFEETANTNQINTENLSSGLYFIQVTAGQNKYQSKFIKE